MEKRTRISCTFHMIYSFLMELLRLADGIATPQKPPLFLAAQDYIQTPLSARLQTQEVADALHISPACLNRLFRRCAADSPHHYIIRRKIEYACVLLSGTDDTCEQISERVGILDAAYFHRVFRRTTGVTPGEYRRMLRRQS